MERRGFLALLLGGLTAAAAKLWPWRRRDCVITAVDQGNRTITVEGPIEWSRESRRWVPMEHRNRLFLEGAQHLQWDSEWECWIPAQSQRAQNFGTRYLRVGTRLTL